MVRQKAACTADPQTPRDPLVEGGARLATRARLRSANRCREESPARGLHHGVYGLLGTKVGLQPVSRQMLDVADGPAAYVPQG